MYKWYSNSYWNSCDWIISYSKHHLEKPQLKHLDNTARFGNCKHRNRLAQSAALWILQNHPKKEERWGKAETVAGKAIPFLCLTFPLIDKYFVERRLESDNLSSSFSYAVWPLKTPAFSLRTWQHPSHFLQFCEEQPTVSYGNKRQGNMCDSILDMTQKPKKAQTFLYWLRFIGHGSTKTKKEPCHAVSTRCKI